jgi:hypothetical protein
MRLGNGQGIWRRGLRGIFGKGGGAFRVLEARNRY